jgi:serine phosphatase RsbU (regulator of sigma subunit)
VVRSGPASRTLPPMPILLVEDDRGDSELVQARLAEVGISPESIICTRNLADALAAMSDGPRCILLDLALPDADGYAAINKLAEAAPQIPVIVLTGRHERDGVEALAAGAQDYLIKDTLTGDLLVRSIRYAIERKRAQRTQEQLRAVRMSAAEKARLERGLLPTPRLTNAGITCSTYYEPGRDHAVLGGDFFDVIETPDGRVRAVIGDVMGHGPDEAALGVHLRVAWRTLALAGVPDEQMLPTLARLLEAEQGDRRLYVTACDLTFDRDRVTMRVAGHPAPILCRDGEPSYPQLAVGPPLGVGSPETDGVLWPDNELPAPPDTAVLLYTDGLLDAYCADAHSESLGIPELVAAVRTCIGAGGAAESWIAQLVARAPRDSVDDTAVVVLSIPLSS